MFEILIIVLLVVAIAGLLFLCSFLAFREGLRLGMNTAKGITPPATKGPVATIIEAVEDVKNAKSQQDTQSALAEMLSFTGDIKR